MERSGTGAVRQSADNWLLHRYLDLEMIVIYNRKQAGINRNHGNPGIFNPDTRHRVAAKRPSVLPGMPSLGMGMPPMSGMPVPMTGQQVQALKAGSRVVDGARPKQCH